MLEREMKRGSAELLILALLEDRERHGYDIGKQIEERSDRVIAFHITSLYPTLHRLQSKGLIEGRWVEKQGQRRRRYYRLTPRGRRQLQQEMLQWEQLVRAIGLVMRPPLDEAE